MTSNLKVNNLKDEIITPDLDIDLAAIRPALVTVAHLQPTDRPIEDRYSAHFDKTQNRLLLGVYDGHSGFETAEYISKTLPPRLLHHPPTSHAELFLNLDQTIISDFTADHSIFRRKSPNWIHHAQLMKAGCTALVLDIDLNNSVGHYANAGDSRLVVCNALNHQILLQTEDLNTKTVSERERLSREHPNEDSMFAQDRLFGRLISTRGFGDGYYKLPKGLFGDAQHRKYIKTLSAIEKPGKIPLIDQYGSLFYAYKTPPYLTARPETGSPYQFKAGDIAVLATDGLWDLVSNEVTVKIVLHGVAHNERHLAKYLLEQVIDLKQPHDDVTIIVLQF